MAAVGSHDVEGTAPVAPDSIFRIASVTEPGVVLGWNGGTGTLAHVVPSTGTVAVLLTQLAMTGPTLPAHTRAFAAYAART